MGSSSLLFFDNADKRTGIRALPVLQQNDSTRAQGQCYRFCYKSAERGILRACVLIRSGQVPSVASVRHCGRAQSKCVEEPAVVARTHYSGTSAPLGMYSTTGLSKNTWEALLQQSFNPLRPSKFSNGPVGVPLSDVNHSLHSSTGAERYVSEPPTSLRYAAATRLDEARGLVAFFVNGYVFLAGEVINEQCPLISPSLERNRLICCSMWRSISAGRTRLVAFLVGVRV